MMFEKLFREQINRNELRIQEIRVQLLEAILPMNDVKKVTDNQLSREKISKRESLVRSSVFGQKEVDINNTAPKIPAVGLRSSTKQIMKFPESAKSMKSNNFNSLSRSTKANDEITLQSKIKSNEKHGIFESSRKFGKMECTQQTSDKNTDSNRRKLQQLLMYGKLTEVPSESYKTPKKTVVTLKSSNHDSSRKLCEQQKVSEARSKQHINRQNEFALSIKSRWERNVNTRMTKEMDCRQKDATATTIFKEAIKDTTTLITQPLPLDNLQQTAISNLETNDYSMKPISICLVDKFNEVVGETDVIETDDEDDNDDENEIVTKWRIRRCTKHQRDMDELSILEDLKTIRILQKHDTYEPKIRIASMKSRSVSRHKDSEGLIFTTPRCVTKSENSNLLLHSVTNKQSDYYSTVTIDSDVSKLSLTSDQSSSTQSSVSTDDSDQLDLVNLCDTSYEMELQKQTQEPEVVSQHQETPDSSEPLPVTDFEITPTHLVATQLLNGNLNRDTIDDSVILQFDPGGSQEEQLVERIIQ